MGGQGSGRKPDMTKKVIEQFGTLNYPVAKASGSDISLPDYSGINAHKKTQSYYASINYVNQQIAAVTPSQNEPDIAIDLDTVYQNTSGSPIIVYGSVASTFTDNNATDTAFITCYTGQDNPPASIKLLAGNDLNAFGVTANSAFRLHFPFSFCVPTDYFYKIESTITGGGILTLDACWVMEMF